MSNLQLDLRRPVIVITGIFNPAIFAPGWVAHHLFDLPVGETVNMAVADGVGVSGLAAFLNAVGISVNQSRLELFAGAGTEEAFEAVERISAWPIRVGSVGGMDWKSYKAARKTPNPRSGLLGYTK